MELKVNTAYLSGWLGEPDVYFVKVLTSINDYTCLGYCAHTSQPDLALDLKAEYEWTIHDFSRSSRELGPMETVKQTHPEYFI